MHPTLLFISFPGFWGIHLNPAPRQYLGSVSYYQDDDDDGGDGADDDDDDDDGYFIQFASGVSRCLC